MVCHDKQHLQISSDTSCYYFIIIASLGAGNRSGFWVEKSTIIKMMIMILSLFLFAHQSCERQRDQFIQTDLWGECGTYHKHYALATYIFNLFQANIAHLHIIC